MSEDGPISTRISNFGFNTSPRFMLNTVMAIGSSTQLAGIAGDAIATAAVEARDCSCTSLSEAV